MNQHKKPQHDRFKSPRKISQLVPLVISRVSQKYYNRYFGEKVIDIIKHDEINYRLIQYENNLRLLFMSSDLKF